MRLDSGSPRFTPVVDTCPVAKPLRYRSVYHLDHDGSLLLVQDEVEPLPRCLVDLCLPPAWAVVEDGVGSRAQCPQGWVSCWVPTTWSHMYTHASACNPSAHPWGYVHVPPRSHPQLCSGPLLHPWSCLCQESPFCLVSTFFLVKLDRLAEDPVFAWSWEVRGCSVRRISRSCDSV